MFFRILLVVAVVVVVTWGFRTAIMKTNILQQQLAQTTKELEVLKNQDQYKRNNQLQAEIDGINKVYKKSIKSYENLQDLRLKLKDTTKLDSLLALAISDLAEKNYASAAAVLDDLDARIKTENDKLTAAEMTPIAIGAPQNNQPPDNGYRRQSVHTDSGDFVVDIVTADLNTTKVIVDTASESDCHDNCPVLPLADYVSRSGAYAGVNGSYFCPADYPSCAGKSNSYDTLVMNKNKKYFNSDNNVYSTVPAAIFYGSSSRFVGQSSEWGRDTSVDAVIANHPLLVSGGKVVASDGGDPKLVSRGNRAFLGGTGNKGYIGVVHNVSVGESAKVMQALGIQNALNLDSGGSTAMYVNGYVDGPGRNIPNAVLFVRK